MTGLAIHSNIIHIVWDFYYGEQILKWRSTMLSVYLSYTESIHHVANEVQCQMENRHVTTFLISFPTQRHTLLHQSFIRSVTTRSYLLEATCCFNPSFVSCSSFACILTGTRGNPTDSAVQWHCRGVDLRRHDGLIPLSLKSPTKHESPGRYSISAPVQTDPDRYPTTCSW